MQRNEGLNGNSGHGDGEGKADAMLGRQDLQHSGAVIGSEGGWKEGRF